jgi:hypothetical protein
MARLEDHYLFPVIYNERAFFRRRWNAWVARHLCLPCWHGHSAARFILAAAVVHAPIREGVDFIDGRSGTEGRSHGWLGRMMCRACRFGFRTVCASGHHRCATGNRHEGDIAMSSSSSRLEVIRTNDRGPTNKRSLRLCIQTCVLVLTSFGVTSPSLARSSFCVWRGQGSSGLCQGTWQAERRSYGGQVLERGAPIYSYAPGRSRQYHQYYQGR